MDYDNKFITAIFVGIACFYVYSCLRTYAPPHSHVQSELMLKAYNIKQNDKLDEVIVVTSAGVTTKWDDGTAAFGADYVDECGLLAQINYFQAKDADDLGEPFLPLQNVSPKKIALRDSPNALDEGSLGLFVILEPRDDFPADTVPYIKRSGKRRLVLPARLYNDMLQKKGQYIFLDKDGNVLDRYIPANE